MRGASLGDRRVILVGILTDMAAATKQAGRDLAAASNEFADVPGAQSFIGLLTPFWRHTSAGLVTLVADAQNMPVDSVAHFNKAKSVIANRIDALGNFQMPHIPNDHSLAVIAATMRSVPECAGMA
ncbi:MAG: hypothetical protein QOF21_1910 [Actinomycetota bacterium]